MADRIQFRRDTSANWATYNPILLEGEIGVVLDVASQYKMGDGVHHWNDLPLRGFDGNIAQTKGSSKTSVMSQKAVSDAIDSFEQAILAQINEYQPIEITGDVTNAADEEDLTSENGLLKFKNRNSLNGKGMIILRRGKTFGEQLTQMNTIYVVQYDYNLSSANVTIPSGSTLLFMGGTISNGTITLDDTNIYPLFNSLSVGNNLTISGTPAIGTYKYENTNAYFFNGTTWKASSDEDAINAINNQITAIKGGSSKSIATLDSEISSESSRAQGAESALSARISTNANDIANLQQLYNNLQQSKPVPVTALPSTGQQQGVIYRLAGTTSYSDYMWNGSSWVLMATYDNAIDDVPTAGSDNLVKSGDVFNVSLQSNIVKNILTGKSFSIECVKQFARQCVNTSNLSVGDTFSVDMLEKATNTVSLLLDLMISDSRRINSFVVKLKTTSSYATYLTMDDNYTILIKGTTSRNGRFTVANTVRYVLFQCNVGETYGIQDGYVEVLPIDSIANSCSNNEQSILDIFESQEKINIPYIEEFMGNLFADGTTQQVSSNFYVQKYDVSIFDGMIGCSGQVASASIDRCGICFYDSNDVFISFLYPSVKSSGYGFHTILDIPVNAKYMRIQGHFGYTKASVFSIKNIIAPKVIREVNEQSIEYGVLQSDGTVSPRTEKNFITKLYDVNTLGNYISLLASYRVTYSNTPIAYYDSDMNCIKTEFTGSGDNADYIHENVALQLPTGTRYIKLYCNERYYTSHLSKLVNSNANEEEKILNILAIGNSWSRDSVTELWSVAKDAGITLKVCQAYQGGSSLYNMYKGMDDVSRVYQHGTFNQYTHGTYQLWEYNGNMPQKTPVSSEYNNGKCGVNDGTAWGKNQDGTWAAMTLQECLSMYNWDIILVSCQGTELQSADALTTINDNKGFFDINDFIARMELELNETTRAKVKWGIMNTWSYPVEMALTYTPTTTMLQALDISDWSALSDAEKQEVYDNMYPNIIKNTQLVANHLADKIHYVCNTATAIQYGRNSEWLKDVAYHMVRSSTDTHLGNGIPKYICGVCIFLSIFNTNKNSILLDYVPDLIDGSGDHSDGGGEANPTTPTRSLCIGSVNISSAAVNYDYQL